MRRPVSTFIIIFLAVCLSVTLAAIASTLALARPAAGELKTSLESLLHADYSADGRGTQLGPLSESIIDAVRSDSQELNRDAQGDVEFVPVFRPGDRERPGTTPAPQATPTPAASSPGSTSTPAPPSTGTQTPGPTGPAPTATPRPGVPTPTPRPSTPTPTPTPAPPPAATATPTPQPTPNSLTFVSAADSSVNSSSPISNNGSAVSMGVSSSERSFLRFALSSIPAGSTVSSASLILCLGGAAGRIHELRPVTSTWTESGVTWNNQPSATGGSTTPVTVPGFGCISVNVKTDVQNWVNGTANLGWRIRDQNESSATLVTYSTREEATSGLRPTLNITYTP